MNCESMHHVWSMTNPLYIVTVVSNTHATLMSTFHNMKEAEEFVAKSTRPEQQNHPTIGCWATITALYPVKWDNDRLDSENEWSQPVRLN
jgi:hypothetical protein